MMGRWLSAVLIVFLLPAAHNQITLMDILFGPARNSGGTGTPGTSPLSPRTGGSSISSSSSSSNSMSGGRTGPIATFNSGPMSSGGLKPLTPSSSRGSNSISSITSLGTAGQSGPSAPGQPYCHSRELTLMFRSCAMSFGMAHMSHFDRLSRLPTCDISVFNCGQVDSLIRCVNSQTIRQVSNRCWPIADKALTSFLHQYNLPCSYLDLKTKCKNTSADLLPLDQRQQQGQGMNTNPMSAIWPVIQRSVMPMVMMMSMGGGGLFGA